MSSEHANGAEKVSLAYNFDGSTTVTNEYGKQATYRFQVIRGSKHIVAIEGQPLPTAPAAIPPLPMTNAACSRPAATTRAT